MYEYWVVVVKRPMEHQTCLLRTAWLKVAAIGLRAARVRPWLNVFDGSIPLQA
jgi:hypothetical protein